MRYIYVFVIIALLLSCSSNERSNSEQDNKNLAEANEYYAYDNYLEAIKHFEQAIDKDSLNPEVMYKLGVSYGKVFSFEKSNVCFNKAIQLSYREVDALFNIGLNFVSLSNDSIALIYFEKAHTLDPNDKEILLEIESCKECIFIINQPADLDLQSK